MKKIKTRWVEIPVFSLGNGPEKFVIYSYRYVPRNNRYKKAIRRTIKRGTKQLWKKMI